ncbi:hypothetical protein HDU91_005404, partial [Kappamyces sp. JEL0680]
MHIDLKVTKDLIERITEQILEQRIEATSDEDVKSGLRELDRLLTVYEEAGGRALSQLESLGDCPTDKLLEIEREILDQSKQYDRLCQLATGSTVARSGAASASRERILKAAPSTGLKDTSRDSLLASTSFVPKDTHIDLETGELVQLQERILQQQDNQLDSLAELLGRQKQVGELIGQELDSQVELLDEVDERAEGVRTGMTHAGQR